MHEKSWCEENADVKKVWYEKSCTRKVRVQEKSKCALSRERNTHVTARTTRQKGLQSHTTHRASNSRMCADNGTLVVDVYLKGRHD